MKLHLKLVYTMLLLISCTGINESELNYQNCLKIKVGMLKYEVIEIMGDPDTIISSTRYKNEITLYYKPPPMASAGVDIIVDENTNRVIKVFCSEDDIKLLTKWYFK